MAQEEITGTEISEFPEASTIYGGDVVAGVQSGSNKKFSFATIFSWIRNKLSAAGISYDPTTAGATADNIQDALDEAFSDLEGKQSTITASGILKGDGAGGVSAATPGTDFATPSQIPTVPSASDSTPQDLGTATPGTSNDYSRADHVHTKPTPADIGAYVKPSGGIPSSDMASAVQTSLGKADSAFQKPSGGIPSSDMTSGVQTSLGKADTAYQKPSGGIPATDLANGVIPTVPSAYTSNPEMDGTASPGSSGAWAKGDHVHPSDTTKANQAQLATVESGSTASRAYAAGEYFCWNGLLYRATAAISVGQSFTPGTNCYQTTVMDMTPPRIIGGDLNNYTTPGLYMWTDATASVPTNAPIVAQSVLIVLQASQAGRVCQIVFAHNATRNGAYYRWLFSNAWTSWYTIG